MMKTILLPFRSAEPPRTAMESAYSVAVRFGSYIEGLFVRQPPPIVSGEGITIPGEYLADLAEETRRLSERAREHFTRFMADKNVPLSDVRLSSDKPSAGWSDVEGPGHQVVGEYGRLFDLIVVGCAPSEATVDRDVLCEAALFDSGRPVLVAAAEPPATLGETVVVAWNGSTETARTIGLGMPFLLGAKKVVVLTVEGATVPGPSAGQVADHLVRNDVKAEPRTVQADSRAAGEAILAECREAGADLLLKGAFTHSRLRQLIFGGATSHILAHADLPVFMAH
ncbi:MAG: universal stress protein [Arenicellales bacterium]